MISIIYSIHSFFRDGRKTTSSSKRARRGRAPCDRGAEPDDGDGQLALSENRQLGSVLPAGPMLRAPKSFKHSSRHVSNLPQNYRELLQRVLERNDGLLESQYSLARNLRDSFARNLRDDDLVAKIDFDRAEG